MQVRPTEIPDVLLIEPRVFPDQRGFFQEVHQQQRYADAGIDAVFVQDNHSRSVRGTLRGLHYQIQRPQAKLIQVLRGEIVDVVVDLRKSSATFGRAVAVTLSEENHRQVFVPIGFAHGFYVVSDEADILYKCSDYYCPEHERTLLWNDPALNVEWPLAGDLIISGKDQNGRPLAEVELFE